MVGMRPPKDTSRLLRSGTVGRDAPPQSGIPGRIRNLTSRRLSQNFATIRSNEWVTAPVFEQTEHKATTDGHLLHLMTLVVFPVHDLTI